MTDIATLAKEIATARKTSGLSQKALAAKLGMKQSQISELETGKRDIRLSTLTDVARALRLELVLVPRQLLPAVQYIVQPQKETADQEQLSAYALGDDE